MVMRILAECAVVLRLLPGRKWFKWLIAAVRAAPRALRSRSFGAIDQEFGQEVTIINAGREVTFANADFGVVREIFGHECYGRKEEFRDRRQVLDLGANAGVFSIYALAAGSSACVHAVEIQPQLCRAARENVDHMGGSARFTVERAAVGGFATDFAKEQLRLNPDLKPFNIKAYIESVGQCDFVKCDVEGAEFSLFDGDVQWCRHVLAFAIEVHPEHGDSNELVRRFERMGFQVAVSHHGRLQYLFCRQPEASTKAME